MSTFSSAGDPCVSSPCQNGGRCRRYGSNYSCDCPKHFMGLRCELASLCASFPCQNGGTCLSLSSYYWCTCTAGYLGFNCNIPANFPEWKQDFTTLTPTTITDMNKSNVSLSVWLFPLIAVIITIITVIILDFALVKKRKRRQRDQQLGTRRPDRIAHSVTGNIHSATRVSRLTSLSEHVSSHPTSRHPSSVRHARTQRQTITCVIEHICLPDCASSHLSPEQPNDDGESRLDGGSVNDGYDLVTDSPPTYLSVVTDPTYIRDEASSLQLPPSYDDVVAAIRPTPAPSDGPAGVTS